MFVCIELFKQNEMLRIHFNLKTDQNIYLKKH